MQGITVIINCVRDEIPLLPRVLNSVVGLAKEIVIIDMSEGEENIEAIAKKYSAKIFPHKPVAYVEGVRNYAIGKAHTEWTLVLDPDEEVPPTLAARLKKIIEKPQADYWRLPRKNIIFGKWVEHSRWWPDYNIRFFKKGYVAWDETIHSVPITKGKGADLSPQEENAIIHHNYQSVNQFLARMDRYTSVQATELERKKYKFIWKDLAKRPTAEFFSRYFAAEGYKDGLHGLALSLLQSFSEVVVYLKVWEKEKFLEQAITPEEVVREFGLVGDQSRWWISDMIVKNTSFLTSLPHRVRRKISERKNG